MTLRQPTERHGGNAGIDEEDAMFLCPGCKQEKPDEQLSTIAGKCVDCARRRYKIALGDLVVATSEQVIDLPRLPFGGLDVSPRWCIALCAHDLPVE
jgi:hypothetical protein